ncbi:MAG: Ig-like domain-containing protein [Eubacterium sp.]|nr:Ig-like domain-containing protein [Eubacterium sp.]
MSADNSPENNRPNPEDLSAQMNESFKINIEKLNGAAGAAEEAGQIPASVDFTLDLPKMTEDETGKAFSLGGNASGEGAGNAVGQQPDIPEGAAATRETAASEALEGLDAGQDASDPDDAEPDIIRPRRRIPAGLIILIIIIAVIAGYLYASSRVRNRLQEIVITPGEDITMKVGTTEEFTWTVSPASADIKVSAGSEMISVKGDTVTALKHGKSTVVFTPVVPSWASIGVRLLGGVDSVSLNVTAYTEYSVSINPKDIRMEPNMTRTINVTITPEEEDKLVKFTSANPAVATVNKGGIVTGVEEGETEITVTVTLPGKEETFTVPVTIIPHTHQFEEAERTDATCLTEGLVRYVCGCGEEYTEVLPIGDHSWVDTENRPATCTEDGHLVRTCSVCGLTEEETTPATGHDWQVTSEQEATCTQPGYTEYTCSHCHETRTETTPGMGHEWYDVARTEPTCESPGHAVTRCARCGEEYSTDLSPYGHDLQVIFRQEPTCTEPGAILYECSRCHNQYPDSLPAPGHEYGEDGLCIRCGQPAP